MDFSNSPFMQFANSGYGQGLLGAYGAALPNGMQGTDVMNRLQTQGSQIADAFQNPMGNMQAQQNMQVNAPAQAIREMQDKANQMDMYKMAAGALQGMSKPQQQAQNPIQIIRDQNQFRFAGMQQNPQMLAQALRNRG